MKLEELVGQQLMIGVSGTQVSPEMIQLFRETHAGGLIVFRPNFGSAKAFTRMIADLESALGRKLLVAVDHEGGRVIHLAEGITVFPDNLAVGHTGKIEYAKEQGEIEALELRRLGLDLNLAPTLDVLTETFSPNIGIRSYGKDPELVAQLGAARIKAMQGNGLSSCAKHFPGLGQSPIDPHLNLPVLPTTWADMKKIHIKPFLAAMKAGVDTIMSSHPIYPNLDPSRIPVTFSKRIIRDYLRKELKFKGVILSDDLEMGALKDLCPLGEAACRTIEAGHDIVLVCHNADAQREAYRDLLQAYHDHRLDYADLEKSLERIEKLKAKRAKRFEGGSPKQEKKGTALAQKIMKEAIQVSKNKDLIPFQTSKEKTQKKVLLVFPKISALGQRIFIEDNFLDEKKFLEESLKVLGIQNTTIEVIRIDPSDHEVEEVRALAGINDCTVFFCFDAHLYPQNRKLLEVVQSLSKQCGIVLLRDPYDEAFVEPEAVCIQVFGFRAVQIRAALETIFSK